MRRRFMNKKDSISINYLTIEALEDNFTVLFRYGTSNSVEYCIDDGSFSWKILSQEGSDPINSGEKLLIRSKQEQGLVDTGIGEFDINKQCNLLGNCMSLIFYDKADLYNDLSGYDDVFYHLFQNCKGIKNVSKNFLPATILAKSCYQGMFYGCTSLIEAPELPATTLADSCYVNMFYNCTSLVNAPELPATESSDNCYNRMFYNCTSLIKAPTKLASRLKPYCCYSMFENCTSLTKAPELPATTLANYCYEYMFKNCTNLSYIKMLAIADVDSTKSYYYVFNVSPTGIFVKNKDATWDTTPGAGYHSGVPAGWTVVNDGEESDGETQPFFRVQNHNGYRSLTYNFEIGMTFGDFVKSKYNVDSWFLSQFLEPGVNNIKHQYDNYISIGDELVTDLDYIVQGETYYWD